MGAFLIYFILALCWTNLGVNRALGYAKVACTHVRIINMHIYIYIYRAALLALEDHNSGPNSATCPQA